MDKYTMKKTVLAFAVLAMAAPVWAENHQPGAHFITNWDLDGDGAVSLEDITTRRGDVFLTFDADENGCDSRNTRADA